MKLEEYNRLHRQNPFKQKKKTSQVLKNEAELLFEIHLKESEIEYKKEVMICPGRQYRHDFVVGNLAIEIQGGIWMDKGAT